MPEALLRDETMTGRPLKSWRLPDLPDHMTARELLRLRVRDEVARHNAADTAVFHSLVRPTDAGHRPPGHHLEWTTEADVACEAFGHNAFVMLTPTRQVESLDDVIDLRHEPEVTFIRLTPLVGG
ncbi:hypothetical protein M1L60_29405 [Actinoplanes sp. TRM 88003]|uniref:RES domain-containing protein n=1 Tax=Paractinoplanes aksuensis TaxID=2939490 RepID=A0ABT1DYM0_9ACTN|nr:hypothetical protein [Actinoplanes aksuensis]MCO8274721.1 hypothetical protein [Actinoplanes aksuensis]